LAKPTATTTYTVTATDINSCSSTATATVTVNPLPTITASGGAYCAGGAGLSLNASGAGVGGSYTWSPATNLSAITVANPIASPTNTSTYTVTGTNTNGCSSTATATVTVNPLPTVTATASLPVLCVGKNTTLTGSGASTYTWNNGVVNGVSFAPTSTKTYTVTGTAANGCTNTASVTITVNPLPNIAISASDNTVCIGANTILTATGASTYVWNNGVVNGVAFAPVTTKSYTVTGTDLNGCINSATATVTVNPLPIVTANASPNVVCIGKTTILNASGASTYIWDNGVTNGVAFAPATTKTYTVTGTDINGCKNTVSTVVTVNPLPTILPTATSSVICTGQSTVLSATGAALYTWNNGVVNGVSFTPTSTKTYTVTGVDANSCQNTANIVITVNAKPTVTASSTSSAVCIGKPITLNGGGALTYTWNNGAVNAVAFNPTLTKTYTVTGTDANGCTNTAEVTITVHALPNVVANASKTSICLGETVVLNGTGALTFAWDNGVTNGIAFAPSTTKSYTVLGTDGNGCQNTATVNMVVNPLPSAPQTSDLNLCKNDPNPDLSAHVTGTNLRWYDDEQAGSFISNPTVNTVNSGINSLFVSQTDGNSCESPRARITIKVNDYPIAKIIASDLGYCKGLENGVLLRAQNEGAEVLYEWFHDGISKTGGLPIDYYDHALAGVWTVGVRNTTTGCTTISSAVTVIEEIPPVAAISTQGPGLEYCKNNPNGTLLIASDAGPNTTYEWFKNGVSQSTASSFNKNYNNAFAGTWSLKVVNTVSTCPSTSASVVVMEKSVPVSSIANTGSNDAYCFGENGITLNAQAIPGAAYEWFKNGISVGSGITKNNALFGTWLLRVTVDGCTDTSNAFIVKEKPLPAAAITLSANSYCADKSGVTITAADAGTGATYEWFLNNVSQGTPNSNPIHFNSIAGDWKVKTLFGGCANTSLVKTVKIDTLPNAQILTSGSALQYCQYTNGVTLMAKDQGAGSIYNWYKDGVLISSTNVNTYSNATKGNWSMMVSNICGAVTQSVSPVTEKLLPNASIAVSASEYCAGTTGVLLTGKAVSGATYQWFKNGLSLGAATFNNTLINALAGNYSVVVSLNGCDSTSAQVQISENSLPTATISGNQSICNKSGELATLDLMLTGQAPWKITYQRPDGKQVSFNATSADQHISESLSGEYKVLKVSDLKCNGTTSGLASVQYFSSPKISNVTRVCLPSATAFVVQFDILDGDVNSYNVSGYAGKLLGNTWTSDSIPENLTITLAINDKNNCNPLIETFSKSCSCLAEATMTGGGVICNDGVSQSMILVALEGKSPWKIEYTIDNGAAVQLDGIIASPYQINTGKNGTYKLTKVFDGNCKGAVNGSATVVYYDFPTATISGESTICTGNESANLMINFTGQSPWKVNILTPNGPQLMSGITTNPLSYQPSAIGDYSLISVNDHHCEGRNTDISGLGRVNAYAKPDSSNLKVLCDSSDQYYIVMDIINGDGQSYQIDGAQGTMVGNQWTSQMIPSGQFTKLTLTDNNTCSPLVISGINKTCLCPASGTITGNRVFCDDSAKASVHIALTGTAPWEITYRLNGGTVVKSTSLTNEFVIHQVSKTTDFNLIQVSDAKCTNSANSQALVIVNELPTAIINGGGEVCENSPSHMLVINFTGTPPYKFSYTDGLTIHDTVSNSGIYQMIKPKDGEYKVLSVTDANGCVATRMEGESKVNVRKFTGASIIGSTGICYGDNTAVTINFDSLTNAPFKLTYDGGDGFEIIDQINTNPYQIQINPKNSSVVKIIELEDLHQCANTNFADSVLIDVTPIPRLKVINNVSSICSGSKTAINFVSVVTGTENSTKFTWTAKQNKNIAGITMTGVSDSISDLLTNLSDKLESVTYTVIPATYTITNKACYGQGKDVQVTVRKPTFPVLGADQSEVCPGTTLFLQPGNFSGGTYSWYINDSLLPNTLEEYSFIVPFGKSSVRSSYKDVCGNIHSDTLWINSKSKVTVDFTKVDTCLGMMTKFTPVQIAGNAVVDSWTWQFVNAGMLTKSDMNRPESSVSFAKPGKQKVILEAFNAGCKLGDTIGYVNIENCDFEIVNTFTPNADGKNDLWEIKGIERFPNAHIVIVNRWGMVVHEIPGPIKAWDGTNDKGELLESGVYYYIITLNKVADSNETIQGHINLIVSSDGR
jgi:gliding motility-associated-like protein